MPLLVQYSKKHLQLAISNRIPPYRSSWPMSTYIVTFSLAVDVQVSQAIELHRVIATDMNMSVFTHTEDGESTWGFHSPQYASTHSEQSDGSIPPPRSSEWYRRVSCRRNHPRGCLPDPHERRSELDGFWQSTTHTHRFLRENGLVAVLIVGLQNVVVVRQRSVSAVVDEGTRNLTECEDHLHLHEHAKDVHCWADTVDKVRHRVLLHVMKRLQAIQWSCLGRHRRTSSRDPVSISQGCAVIKDTSEQLWRQGYEQVGRGELGLFAVLAVLLHDHLRSPNTPSTRLLTGSMETLLKLLQWLLYLRLRPPRESRTYKTMSLFLISWKETKQLMLKSWMQRF